MSDKTVRFPAAAPARGGDGLRARRFRSARTIMALILREMTTSYGRSPGGYLWAILEPVGAVMVLSVGFSLLLRTPPLGTSFLLFYASGFLVFNLYNKIANATARSVRFSRPLLSYPGVTWIDSILARFILNTLTQAMVTYIVMTGILVVIDSHVVLDFRPILAAIALAAALGLGVGTMNCFLMGIWPVWEQIWSIVTRPLFLASGLFYIYEDLPRAARDVLWWNPLMHVTGTMRTGFFPTYDARFVSPAYVWGVAGLTTAAGLLLLGRFHRDILARG